MPILVALLGLATAHGQEIDSHTFTPRPFAGHALIDLRVGVDRLDSDHPFLCGEITALPWLSIEGCGTGSGLLHRSSEPEMAHFRTRGRLWGIDQQRTELDLLVGAGFAEIQVAEDAHGFKFGKAQSTEQVEAAGPELSLSAKGRLWIDKGGRTYVTADINAGVAHIPAAPVVTGGSSTALPFAAFTVGFGL